MSNFTNDFLNELSGVKKKNTPTKTSGSTTTKKKKRQETAVSGGNDFTTEFLTALADDDIAPVRTTVGQLFAQNEAPLSGLGRIPVTTKKEEEEEDDKPWYQSGLFADGYDFGDVTKTILGINEDSASLLDLTWNSAKRGFYNARLGEESYDALMGSANEKEKYEQILAGEEFQFTPGNNFASGISGAFELLGQQARQFTNPRTLALTGTAATMAAVAGQAGPQVLLPEEIITVPGAAVAAFTAGSAASNLETEAGLAYNEMIEAGITEETARKVALGVGTVNAGLELLQVDELLDAYKVVKGSGVTKSFANRILEELVDRGIDVATETAQEVAQEGVTIAGVQAANRIDNGEWAYNAGDVASRLLDTAKSSALSFGMMNAPAAVRNTVTIAAEQNAENNLTSNERAVVDKIVEDRVAEAKKKGETVSKKQIYNEVIEQMEKGGISTDIIEEVLGGETYKAYQDAVAGDNAVLKEFSELYKGEELQQQVEDYLGKSSRFQIREQLSNEVSEKVKGDRLLESYNERARRGQRFEADLTQYDAKLQPTIQKAIDSGILNNTNRTHEFVDIIANISADKGVPFDFVNNEKLKESGFAVEGKTVNGLVTDDGISINVDSPKAWQSTVGHEITHVLEGTEFYDTLQQTLFDYAKSRKASSNQFNSEYQERLYNARQTYKDVKGYEGVEGFNKIKREVVADLVGDYLFTDSNFVNNLSANHRNIFQKIYDEIKYLSKVVKAGSKEARDLERVKKAFEDAYRADNAQNNTANSGAQYSLNIEYADGTVEELADLRNLTDEQSIRYLESAQAFELLDETYIPVRKELPQVIIDTLAQEDVHLENRSLIMEVSKARRLMRKGSNNGNGKRGHNLSPRQIIDIINDIENPVKIFYQTNRVDKDGAPLPNNVAIFVKYSKNGVNGFATVEFENPERIEAIGLEYGEKNFYTVNTAFFPDTTRNGKPFNYIEELENNPYNIELEIKRRQPEDSANWEKHPSTTNELPSIDANVAQKGSGVNGLFSLSDSDGKKLSNGQQEYFKDSKMRDENGNLKVMYHGSQDAGFHVFNAQMSDDGTSFFFVDRNDVAASYSGTSEVYEARTIRTAEDMNNFLADINADDYEVIERDGKYVLMQDGDEVATSDTAQGIYEEFCWYEGVGEGDANYKVYLNLKNPLEVDAQGRPWNKIDAEFSQEVYDKFQSLTEEEKAALVDLAEWEDFRIFNSELQEARDNELASAYQKLGEDINIYDVFSVAADNFSEESLRENSRHYLKTRDYAQRAKEQGYDGVIFKNIVDNGGYSNGSEGASTVAIAFDSNQIKSTANTSPTADKDIRYSLSGGKAEVVNGIAVASNTAEVMKSSEYSKPKDYMTRYSISTTPAWEKNYLAVNKSDEAQQVVNAIRAFTDKMVQDDAVRGYVPIGEYKTTKMGPLRTNQEYIWTFDMDTSCPRTFQFLNFRDAIQRKAGRYLTYNESINLLELMRAYGQQIPCCYCYVENKRVLLSASYNNFFGFRNAVMNAATDEDAAKVMYGYSEKKGLPDASQKAMARWRSDMSYNPSLTEVWTATNTARNSVLNFLDGEMAVGNINAKTPESKLNKMILDHYGITDKGAVVEIESFVKDWAYDTLAKIPHIYNTDNDTSVSVVDERALALNHEALAYSKSASSAKSVENYLPYTDQLKNVSAEDREYIMGMGGIRKHSSNDFRMDYVQDYFLFYADLAAGKWTGHTYTKSSDFAKIFACTGDRINMSVAFYEDADGTLRPNTDEGAFWNDVKDLRKVYKNVGSMAMVTSDNQLSYALNADWIDMIIPFHASGLDKSVWYNLRMWNDYTSKQGERFYSADTMKQKLKDAGIEVPKGANAARVKALFEETFQIKHIYGKNGEILKPHFFPGDTYVNGQLVPGHHNDAETYFRLCEEYGVHPRFYGIKVEDKYGNQIDVTEHPSYLKLIKETSRTDTPQEVIQFNFGNYDDYLKMTPFEYAMQRLQEEAKNGGFENTKADPYGIVEEFTKEYLNQNRPLGYLTDRAKETREILLEMSRESARQQAQAVEEATMSLSRADEAPRQYGNFATPATDLMFAPIQETAPVQKVATPVQKTVANNATAEFPDDLAPMAEEAVTAQQSENINTLTDADMPPENEPYYGEPDAPIAPSNPFEERDFESVGDRKVKAYMYENPEVKPFFQAEANVMLGELRNSTKGGRLYNDELYDKSGGEEGWSGVKRNTSEDIAYLLDKGYSYAEIEKGLNAIIEDNGKENIAIAKRIEFLLNDRLFKGYTDFDTGMDIPPDQDYINLVNEKRISEYSEDSYASLFESIPDDFAPVAETAAPAAEDIAPVAYEAIRPKREPQPKLIRVNDANARPGEKQRKWVGTSTESEVVNREILPDDLDQNKIFYQPIPNKVTLGKANAMLDRQGYEQAITYFNSKLADKRTTLEDIALGERLIQEAMKRGDTKTAGELIQNVAILGTELGQKVQALSIIQRMTPEGQLKMLRKTIERGKAKGDKAYEGVELTQDLIDHILKTYGKDGSYDQDQLNQAVEDVKKKIADQMNVSALDKVNAWRYLSMLGNPKTHIRNLVSNIAMQGTVKVKNAVARTIESIAPISNRTKTWKASSDEVKNFAKQTAEEMKEILMDGGKYSEDASIKEKRDTFKNKILNGLYEFNNDWLSKEDWWFSKPAFTSALSEYLTANGIVTAEDIRRNKGIVEKAKLYATEQSQIATFRQYSWLANEINRWERRNAAFNIGIGSILPFKKTPINIARTGLNYSPLGFAKTLTYDASKVKNGEMEASTMIDHLAQNVTGSALTLVGYMLASAGFLNGSGDDDKEGKYDYQLGKQGYSATIGDATYSLSWLSPVAMPLFVGANAYEQLVEDLEWNGDVVVQTLAQTLDPLSEMSFLSSLDSVLSSYSSGFFGKLSGAATTAAQSYVSQFVPTLSSQVATVFDDTKRTTKVAGDSDFKAFDTIINNLMYKIPGLRNMLEPSTDIWGNEIKQSENVIQRAVETFIAPYARREDISTSIDSELKDLYRQTGDNGVIPSIPYNYTNFDGVKYEMSENEYTAYKETYGQTAYDLMADLFRTNTYRNADSETRAEMVNMVFDYARDEAKRELLENHGVDYTNATEDGEEYYKENSIVGAIEYDVTPEEYEFMTDEPEKYSFFKENGISYETYANADEDEKRAYSWAYENPGKFTMSKAISDDFLTYYQYRSDCNDFDAKDANGNTVNGLKKRRVRNYIFSLDIDYGAQAILFRSMYDSAEDKEEYNWDIVNYLNSRDDISFEEMRTILIELDFEVDSQGNISW